MTRVGGLFLVAGLTTCAFGAGRWLAPRPEPAGRAPPGARGSSPVRGGIHQESGVPVVAVEATPGVTVLRLQGRVAVDERRVRVLRAATEGSMVRLSGATAGSMVQEGQWLGAFFSADLRPALQAHVTALDVQDKDPLRLAPESVRAAPTARAASAADFAVERLLGFGVSRRQIAEMSRTRALPMEIDLYAPTGGLVLSRGVTVGQSFDRGADWFRIANLDRVWIVVDLPDGTAGIEPGTRATTTVPGRKGSWAAVVGPVPPELDPASQKLLLRLEAENPGGELRPDQPVDVVLELPGPSRLTVPATAVVDGGRRRTVFVTAGDGVFEPRAVETGWRGGDRVEVLSGLGPGERIAGSGAFLVDAESRLPVPP